MGTHGASVFILTAVDDVWVCKLRDPTTFYTGVLPSDILKHLQECCKGLHAIKTVNPPAHNPGILCRRLKHTRLRQYNWGLPSQVSQHQPPSLQHNSSRHVNEICIFFAGVSGPVSQVGM